MEFVRIVDPRSFPGRFSIRNSRRCLAEKHLAGIEWTLKVLLNIHPQPSELTTDKNIAGFPGHDCAFFMRESTTRKQRSRDIKIVLNKMHIPGNKKAVNYYQIA